jgi:hypothetical protein
MAEKTPTSQSLFAFDPSDVRLKVKYKSESTTAHVSSYAMSFASHVWKEFVFPTWKPFAAKTRPLTRTPHLMPKRARSPIQTTRTK